MWKIKVTRRLTEEDAVHEGMMVQLQAKPALQQEMTELDTEAKNKTR